MGRIPDDIIDSVLAAHDVVEVVGRYVALKSAGRSMKACCPFHDEKTPSFTVNPDRQTFKCFGCGKGGNIFRFLMEHEGMTFPEAVKMLARERGIQVPQTHGRSPQEEGRYDRAHRALTFAQSLFRRALDSEEGREARAYLVHRGYDAAAQKRFGLGYAPKGWDRLLRAAARKPIPREALEDAGLVVRREGTERCYDRFRNRVIFPIADLQGRVVTFGARALDPDDTPKYLNGPETPVFKKAHPLFALDRAKDAIRRTGEALLMEGYTDVLMCHLHGLDRAVAGMGTAFTSRQAGLLKRFARRVVLVYDGDEAGQTAAERTLEVLLTEGLEIRVALLPAGRDIDEILQEEGVEVVDAILGRALDILEFKLRVLGERFDLDSPDGRARVGEALVATLVKVPGAVARDQWIRAAAERLGGLGAEAALREEAGRHLREEGRRRATRSRPSVPASSSARAPGVFERSRRDAESFLLAGIFADLPDLRARIFRTVGPEDFTDPAMRRTYNAVLQMADAGEGITLRALLARFADDAEVQDIVAGLPEDPTLEERLTFHIEFLEKQRRDRRRADDILRDLDLGGSEHRLQDADPVDGPGHDGRGADGPGGDEGGQGPSIAEREQVG